MRLSRQKRTAWKVRTLINFLAWMVNLDEPECAWCYDRDDLTVDHIRGRNGPHPRTVSYETRLANYLEEAWEDPSSLRILCRMCNSRYRPWDPHSLDSRNPESMSGWDFNMGSGSYLNLPGQQVEGVPF